VGDIGGGGSRGAGGLLPLVVSLLQCLGYIHTCVHVYSSLSLKFSTRLNNKERLCGAGIPTAPLSLCLPTFSHFLIVLFKTSLSLSLFLPISAEELDPTTSEGLAVRVH
jgi:hypothetical protein